MYNHVGLQGRLTRDPEYRTTTSGVPVASFTLAVDAGYKVNDQSVTYFIDCVAWRGTADFVSKYITKGRLVLVEGELTTRSYVDKDGNNRKAVEINAQSVHFCDSKKDAQSDGQNGAGAAEQARGKDYSQTSFRAPDGFTAADNADDGDLPF